MAEEVTNSAEHWSHEKRHRFSTSRVTGTSSVLLVRRTHLK